MVGFEQLMKTTLRTTSNGVPFVELMPLCTAPSQTLLCLHGWGSDPSSVEFQARVLAIGVGARVILPEAPLHASRAQPHWNPFHPSFLRLRASCLLDAVEELRPAILEWLREPLPQGHSHSTLGVVGSSFGGMTAGCLLASHPQVQTAVSFNGSWNLSALVASGELEVEDPIDVNLRLEELCPLINPSPLFDKSFLLLHGREDTTVPLRWQQHFWDEHCFRHRQNSPHEAKPPKSHFIPQPGLGHLVTTRMLELAVDFLNGRFRDPSLPPESPT